MITKLNSALTIVSILVLCANFCQAQTEIIDSLKAVISKQTEDSNKVKTLNTLAYQYSLFNSAEDFKYANEALQLAKKIHFSKGEIYAASLLGYAYNNTGNYNKAMEIFLQELPIAEKNNDPRALANTLMNIGILHTQQKDYVKALPYYLKSDSIIRHNDIDELSIYSLQNLGDIYDRINNLDSALYYYNRALIIAKNKKNGNIFIGAAFIGLGNCYQKMKEISLGLNNYYKALEYLKSGNQRDLYCEALYNISNVFDSINKPDSALHYAREMYRVANQDTFRVRMVDAATLLSSLFKKRGNYDSAYSYLQTMSTLKDSISGREKIKDFQIKSINEDIRQKTLEFEKAEQEKVRHEQLQLLLIGIFIPVIFLITLLLSRRKIHIKVIQVLGIVSLLILFEYLTLLLHPYVMHLSNNVPVIELLIFVCMAAILIPGHHRMERWLIHKLTHANKHSEERPLNIKRQPIKIKRPDSTGP